jgi:putative ABC transport system substrate-binding protein
MRVIGFLSPGSEASFISDFFDALAELGWSEGKNVVVERRNAENRVERLPELAAELVRLNVDVIVATRRSSLPRWQIAISQADDHHSLVLLIGGLLVA